MIIGERRNPVIRQINPALEKKPRHSSCPDVQAGSDGAKYITCGASELGVRRKLKIKNQNAKLRNEDSFDDPTGAAVGLNIKKSLTMTTPLRSQSYAGQEGKKPHC